MSDDLQALMGQAAAVDNQHAEPVLDEQGQPVQEPQAPNFELEAAGAVDTFAALVVGYAPKAAPLWDQPTKTRITQALAPVMEKYGFTFGALPPEITLIIVAGPVLYASSKVVAAQMAEQKAAAQAERIQQANAQAKEVPGESPAPAVHPQMGLYAG